MSPKRAHGWVACLMLMQACGPEAPQSQPPAPQGEELSPRDSTAELDLSRSRLEGGERVHIEVIELCVRLEPDVRVPDARVELLPDGTLVHDGTSLEQPSIAPTRQLVDALENLAVANRPHATRPRVLQAYVSPTNDLDTVWPLLRAPGFSRKVQWSTALRVTDARSEAHPVLFRPAMHVWPSGVHYAIGLKVLHEPSDDSASEPSPPRTVFDMGPSTRLSAERLRELLGLIRQREGNSLLVYLEFGTHSTARDLLAVCSMLLEFGYRDVNITIRRSPPQRRRVPSLSGIDNVWIPRDDAYALGKTRLQNDVRDPEQRASLVPSLEWSHSDQAWLFSARDPSSALGDGAHRYLIDPRDGAITKPSE